MKNVEYRDNNNRRQEWDSLYTCGSGMCEHNRLILQTMRITMCDSHTVQLLGGKGPLLHPHPSELLLPQVFRKSTRLNGNHRSYIEHKKSQQKHIKIGLHVELNFKQIFVSCFLFQTYKITSNSSSVNFSGASTAIFSGYESLLSVRYNVHVGTCNNIIWEKLLSTDAIEIGIIRLILCQFGNIVISISIMCSLI